MTHKSDADLRDLKLDLAIVDNMFDKWYKEEESLSGVLNMKIVKQKNNDIRLKLDVWKKRLDERKRLKKRTFEQGKKLREVFNKFSNDFNIEKDKVLECIVDYNRFIDDKEKFEKEEKIVNDFLSLLPDS